MRRIDELLSSLGYCTRREAQSLCAAGRLRLEGGELLGDASRRVHPLQVRLDGAPLEFPQGLLVMMHKPVGLVCSHEVREGPRVYDLLPERWLKRSPKVTTVGRLDKETSGLLLLTDQGALVQRLTSPHHQLEKVYVARLDGEPPPEASEAFALGLELRERGMVLKTLPATLRPLGGTRVEVTLREGKYHQVRRMFAALGMQVLALERIRFGEWSLGELAPGTWRALPLP